MLTWLRCRHLGHPGWQVCRPSEPNRSQRRSYSPGFQRQTHFAHFYCRCTFTDTHKSCLLHLKWKWKWRLEKKIDWLKVVSNESRIIILQRRTLFFILALFFAAAGSNQKVDNASQKWTGLRCAKTVTFKMCDVNRSENWALKFSYEPEGGLFNPSTHSWDSNHWVYWPSEVFFPYPINQQRSSIRSSIRISLRKIHFSEVLNLL